MNQNDEHLIPASIDQLTDLSLKVQRLKIALKYYADSKKWDPELRTSLNLVTDIPILDDKGRVARLALKNN